MNKPEKMTISPKGFQVIYKDGATQIIDNEGNQTITNAKLSPHQEPVATQSKEKNILPKLPIDIFLPKEVKECCEKCKDWKRTDYIEGEEIDIFECSLKKCPCHSPTQEPKEEVTEEMKKGWTKEWIEEHKEELTQEPMEWRKQCKNTHPGLTCNNNGCNCGRTDGKCCSAYNIKVMKNNIKNWEIEFDKIFGIMEVVAHEEVDGVFAIKEDADRVKNFISKVIKQAEERHNENCTREEWARGSERERILKELGRFVCDGGVFATADKRTFVFTGDIKRVLAKSFSV